MRSTVIITIETAGRDHGKVFRITEASPMRVEDWVARALQVMLKAGVEVPPNFATMTRADLVMVALHNFGALHWPDVKPLLNEMLTCVEFAPDPAKSGYFRPLEDADISEMATLLKLRDAVVLLHVAAITNQSAVVAPAAAAAKFTNRRSARGHHH